MNVNLQKNDVKLSICKLSSPKNFRKWNTSFTRYIGTLQLKYLIRCNVAEPLLQLPSDKAGGPGDYEAVKAKVTSNTRISQTFPQTVFKLCPVSLKAALLQGNSIQFLLKIILLKLRKI